jgi:hypothetical protein
MIAFLLTAIDCYDDTGDAKQNRQVRSSFANGRAVTSHNKDRSRLLMQQLGMVLGFDRKWLGASTDFENKQLRVFSSR